jgi:single-strand DNA-binding protein
MNETTMTPVGNLVADPEMRYTPQGQPVARFRVASTPRFRDNTTGERKDSEALFLTCNAWRQLAENVAESLERGSRVIVSGRLRQRSDEKDGEKRTVHELEADKIGPSLRNATAKVWKVTRVNGERGPGQPPGRREGRGPVGQPGRRMLLRRAAVLAQVPETPVRTSPPARASLLCTRLTGRAVTQQAAKYASDLLSGDTWIVILGDTARCSVVVLRGRTLEGESAWPNKMASARASADLRAALESRARCSRSHAAFCAPGRADPPGGPPQAP